VNGSWSAVTCRKSKYEERAIPEIPENIWIVVGSCLSTLLTTWFGLWVRRWFRRQDQREKNERALLRAMPEEEYQFLTAVVQENTRLRSRLRRFTQRELLLQGKIRQLQQSIYFLYQIPEEKLRERRSQGVPEFSAIETDPTLDPDEPQYKETLEQLMKVYDKELFE
jgi:hypothetical protein